MAEYVGCACRYAVAPSFPPLPDEVVEGARPINRSVEKNRGLTPHRCVGPCLRMPGSYGCTFYRCLPCGHV